MYQVQEVAKVPSIYLVPTVVRKATNIITYDNPHASLSRHTRHTQRSRSLTSISAVQQVVVSLRLHAEALT